MASAMKVVVGGFLSAVVDGAAAKTVAYLSSNYDVPERAKELLGELETKLNLVEAISEEADNRLITNANLVQRLKCLHAAAQEAEDALDEFEVCEASSGGGKRKVSELIASSLRSLKRLALPDSGLGRLEHAVRTLTLLCDNSGTFIELLKLDHVRATQQQAGVVGDPSSHLPLDARVFGRDEVMELILKLIIGSSYQDHAGSSHGAAGKATADRRSILVLPIVGMSGVGKTTLARVIYNHAKVKERFQHRAWVYVAGHFGLKRTLQEILCSLNGYENTGLLGSADTMEATITKLRSKLSGEHTFFLVLDKLWEEMCQEWSTLLTALSDEGRQHGSVVLVTTQSQRVAQLVATMFPINLKPLPWDSFWPLFRYHAFGGTEFGFGQQEAGNHHNMLKIGEEIAKKLEGLPLAAKVIGNLLRRRFSWESWRTLAESDWWDLGEALQGILPYLKVSYQHLTPKQRQCFAFCSIFPRNCLFDKDRTVQMWIAHDFIHSKDVAAGGMMRLEDAGRQCFDELVDRSMFEPTIVSNKYVLHDSARGLAIAVSPDQCFFHAQTTSGAEPSSSSSASPALENVRHLSLQTAGSLEECQGLHKYRNLRTLLLFGRFESGAFFSLLDRVLRNSPSLRVLDLSYVEAKVTGWPTSDASRGMRKLRFLDLSFTRIAKLKDLPTNLQVLHLRGYGASCLPQSITRLANLRHLYADDSALSNVQGIGHLTELQDLDSFVARKGQGFMLRELKNMRELSGQLCIRGVENVRSKEEALEARLVEKKHLSALVIEGRKVPKFALEALQPHPNIKELTIKFYQDQVFPQWMLQPDNLANLSQVNLESCRFLSTLPPLGHLPLLKLLSLKKLPSLKHVDSESLGGFPSLEELKVQWLDHWVEWKEPNTTAAAAEDDDVTDRSSPFFLGCLKKLHLESCQSLRQLPRLSYLSALRELKISEPGSYILALPGCPRVLANLKTLKIEYCHQICVLSAHEFKSLQNLELIKCECLRLADGFQFFSNLRSAWVEGCPELLSLTASTASEGSPGNVHESKQEKQQGPNLLAHLRTDHSLMSGNYFSTVGNLQGLRSLCLSDMPRITRFSDEQELWFQQLTSLESLDIVAITTLEHLPSSLCFLSSMKTLKLSGLTNLQSLPEDALPPKLQELHISNCHEDMVVRVSKDGVDWPKVAHVPYIQVLRTPTIVAHVEHQYTVIQNM